MEARITQRIAPEICLPAGGQGAVGIESRNHDERVNHLLAPLNNKATAECVIAERAMNRRLEGGCQVPIACYAVHSPDHEQQLWLRGRVGSPDGKRLLIDDIIGAPCNHEAMGIELAERLLAKGADDILQAVYEDD
jgi:hydroxymethylbilane synthase